MDFIDIAAVDEIAVGKMKSFSIKGKEILVVNYDGKYYATSGKCPHMGGDLSKGRLDGKNVICPRHGSKFDITTGNCIKGPKIGFLNLKTKNITSFNVNLEGNRIQVKV